jgi:hypothetical protein
MPDYVIVNGQRIELPRETEGDLAKRAAFIAKVTAAAKPPKAKE